MANFHFNGSYSNSWDDVDNWVDDYNNPTGTLPGYMDGVYIENQMLYGPSSSQNFLFCVINTSSDVTINTNIICDITCNNASYIRGYSSGNVDVYNGIVDNLNTGYALVLHGNTVIASPSTTGGDLSFYDSSNSNTSISCGGAVHFYDNSSLGSSSTLTCTSTINFQGFSKNYSSISTDTYFTDYSENWGALYATNTFDQHAVNKGDCYGPTTFNTAAYNDANCHYSTYFHDSSSNTGTCSTNLAAFDGTSFNTGTCGAGATFNGYSYNAGIISGNTWFYDDSQHRGSITGNVTLYDRSITCENSTIIGDLTHDPTWVYAGGRTASAGVMQITNVPGYTMIPGPGQIQGTIIGIDSTPVTVIVFENNTYNVSSLLQASIFNGNSYNQGALSGNATFNDESYLASGSVGMPGFPYNVYLNTSSYSAISGVLTIPDGTTFNCSIYGTIYGSDSNVITACVLNGSAHWTGRMPVPMILNGTSQGSGGVVGDIIVNDSARFSGGGSEAGNVVFNGTSGAYGSISVATGKTITFNNNSYVDSGAQVEATTIVFNNSSINKGNVLSDTIFNNNSYNHADGYVNAVSITFKDSSYNRGTLNGSLTIQAGKIAQAVGAIYAHSMATPTFNLVSAGSDILGAGMI